MEKVDLNPGDSAVVIRHEEGEDAGFEIEIYHYPIEAMPEEDLVFYTLLTRGMAYHAAQDTNHVLDMGRESLGENEVSVTQH